MSQFQPPALLHFFVFNPTLGNEETESKKLLYFYPPSTPVNTQKDLVGIIEGFFAFTSDLTPTPALHCVRSDEALYGVLPCEVDHWMVISVRHPATVTRLKGGDKRVEFQTEAIDDEVLPSLLHRAHSFFRLCNGPLHLLRSLYPVDVIRAKLDLFYRFYLPTLLCRPSTPIPSSTASSSSPSTRRRF